MSLNSYLPYVPVVIALIAFMAYRWTKKSASNSTKALAQTIKSHDTKYTISLKYDCRLGAWNYGGHLTELEIRNAGEVPVDVAIHYDGLLVLHDLEHPLKINTTAAHATIKAGEKETLRIEIVNDGYAGRAKFHIHCKATNTNYPKGQEMILGQEVLIIPKSRSV
ncbi:hypothetical protein [Pseudomonas sp. NPDC089734]|uniref:hypothetical protein n=1 Tax=Pseudomonas sp. NPDC089734 TaxID=3364469 RepID=UPI0038138756